MKAMELGVVVAPTDHSAAITDVAHAVEQAGLESLFAYCLGCRLFALLIRAGVVPERVCLECADIRARGAAGA